MDLNLKEGMRAPIIATGSVGLISLSFVAAAFKGWPSGSVWTYGFTGAFVLHACAGIGSVLVGLAAMQAKVSQGALPSDATLGGDILLALTCAAFVMLLMALLFMNVDIVDVSLGRVSVLELGLVGSVGLTVFFLMIFGLRAASINFISGYGRKMGERSPVRIIDLG